MSAMVRQARCAVLLAALLPFVSLATPHAKGQDVQQYLRDQYRGKTFVLRGFPTGDALHYDSSGAVDSAVPGDWTTDGFVQVNDIHVSDDRLIIKAQRMVAGWLDTKFELRPLERSKKHHLGKEASLLAITADPGMHNPSAEQVDAIASKIFLTAQDSFADLVPDYWKPCVSRGLQGTDKKCAFESAFLAIPGVVAGASDNSAPPDSGAELKHPEHGIHSVGNGVNPPRVIYQHEPEFSEPARVAKYQGTIFLSLVVTKEGKATNIRITQPLGYGLDAKAVKAVEGWKFIPAEKDGVPVATQIMVEVDFHLY